MFSKSFKEVAVQICVAYTIVSMFALVAEWIHYGTLTHSQDNLLMQFGFTAIFILILRTYKIFTQISPLLLGIIQVVVAECIVFLVLFIGSFFTEMHPDGPRDMFISTMIPFIIGAIIYYSILYFETKKNNVLIRKLAEKNKDN